MRFFASWISFEEELLLVQRQLKLISASYRKKVGPLCFLHHSLIHIHIQKAIILYSITWNPLIIFCTIQMISGGIHVGYNHKFNDFFSGTDQSSIHTKHEHQSLSCTSSFPLNFCMFCCRNFHTQGHFTVQLMHILSMTSSSKDPRCSSVKLLRNVRLV